jgi:hypothetical protein
MSLEEAAVAYLEQRSGIIIYQLLRHVKFGVFSKSAKEPAGRFANGTVAGVCFKRTSEHPVARDVRSSPGW